MQRLSWLSSKQSLHPADKVEMCRATASITAPLPGTVWWKTGALFHKLAPSETDIVKLLIDREMQPRAPDWESVLQSHLIAAKILKSFPGTHCYWSGAPKLVMTFTKEEESSRYIREYCTNVFFVCSSELVIIMSRGLNNWCERKTLCGLVEGHDDHLWADEN